MSKIALMYACSECFGQQSKRKEEIELKGFAGIERNGRGGEHRKRSKDNETPKAHTRDRSVQGVHTHQPDDLGIAIPALCFGSQHDALADVKSLALHRGTLSNMIATNIFERWKHLCDMQIPISLLT